jgi:hypothetical protein
MRATFSERGDVGIHGHFVTRKKGRSERRKRKEMKKPKRDVELQLSDPSASAH